MCLCRETKLLSCVMKGDCADRAMELYNALELRDVFVVVQLARVFDNPEGLLIILVYSHILNSHWGVF